MSIKRVMPFLIPLSFAACQTSPMQSLANCVHDSCCIADPVPHCVRGECRDASDCPAGLECLIPNGSDVGSCAWNPVPPKRSALRDGFGITRDLIIDFDPGSADPGSAMIKWDGSGGTGFMACAVFGCNPVFLDKNDMKGSLAGSLPKISNFNSCALGQYVVEFSRSRIVLASPGCDLSDGASAGFPAGELCSGGLCSADGLCNGGRVYGRIIETLSLGCWAYDDHQIVAVGDLVAVLPDVISRVFPIVPSSPICEMSGAACYNPEHSFFGGCDNGVCQPRCAPGQDCQLVAARYLGDESHTWACKLYEDSRIGVCVQTGVAQ